ncbi:MAG TPA: DUF1329 domain-containing protein [Candidatus Binataceae bacterium]|nr:DUF1329 domain-containing protein [Candidatus Binataceae bacterium]
MNCGNSGLSLSSCRRWITCVTIVGALAFCCASAFAQQPTPYTRATFDQWLHQYANAKPDFKPGDVLTYKDVNRLRPFIPPGYLELLNFPQFKAQIVATVSHRPRQDYLDCTEKHQGQVRLAADGALMNFVCGQPFSDNAIKMGDPTAGMKAAWNFEYRWQNYGLAIFDVGWIWDRFGGTHTAPSLSAPPMYWVPITANLPTNTADLFEGGGTFQRVLQGPYQRVYYSHLAQLDDKGAILPVSGAKDFEFKEFTGFSDPFDIRGTAFIIYRYSDPHRADDSWAYIPELRRVRRISAEVKSDSLLGTDHTLADFYGFSGRELEWNWKFLGWKDALCVMDSKYDNSHFYGPEGIVPNDVWTVRRFAVIERTPKDPRAPYSSVVDFFDAENWDAFWMEAWDHKDNLWKAWEFQKKWSETYKDPSLQAINKGTDVTNFQSVQVVDLQNNRGTLVPCFGGGYPNVSPATADKLFDISKLEEIHR